MVRQIPECSEGIFMVYGYFYNLVVFSVIINTLLCNPIWIK